MNLAEKAQKIPIFYEDERSLTSVCAEYSIVTVAEETPVLMGFRGCTTIVSEKPKPKNAVPMPAIIWKN